MNRWTVKNKIEIKEVEYLLKAIEQASITMMPELMAEQRMGYERFDKIDLKKLRSGIRRRELVYGRMIFTHHCLGKFTISAIAKFLNIMEHGSILNHQKNFENDIRYRSEFRRFHQEVGRILEELQNKN
jgi:hypothetical protein